MTTGVPIFLVSACASGEEFVAAFRRYADRNGLFVPIAAPIPAGRRGRFAVTLKDGGVMIEGEADIISSATTPSVLHGRVGMTLRFVEPDIRSKTVLVELEQARLAMKPQPPSVPPRPAQIPAEPRPKVPTPTGRIDANNALAECVAIGDIDALETTVPQVPKSGAPKFVVPSIPPVGAARPKAPSTPPIGYPTAPATPAKPTSAIGPRAQTPSVPPPLAALPPDKAMAKPVAPTPTPRPPAPTPSKPTPRAPVTPMSITTVDAPIVTPTRMTAVKPAVEEGWDTSDEPAEAVEPPRDTIAMPALSVSSEMLAEAAALQRSRSASDEMTIVPQARDAEVFQVPRADSDTFPAVQVESIGNAGAKPDAVPEPMPEASISKPNGNSGRTGLPPPRRTSGNTQPPPPRMATPAAPLPIVGKPTTKPSGSIATPRAATQIGLPIVQMKTPAQPSGQIPLPPVVAPDDKPKPPPPELEEPTDITSVPVVPEEVQDSAAVIASSPPADVPPPPARPHVPGGMRKTVMGIAVVPGGVTVLPATPSAPIAKVTQDEDEIDAPSEPTEQRPTVDPAAEPTPAAEPLPLKSVAIGASSVATNASSVASGASSVASGASSVAIEEPSGDWTMIPGEAGPTILPRKPEAPAQDPGKKPGGALPTGDWTIARVENSPDGWSAPVRANIRANTGPPVAMVAGEKALEVTMTAKAFDIEEETKSGLKVEIDSSLGASLDPSLASTQFAVPVVQLTPPPGALRVPLPGMPPPITAAVPVARAPSHGSGSVPDLATAPRGSAPANLFGGAAVGDSTSMIHTRSKKRIVIIVVSAVLAIAAGVVLFVMLGRGGSDDAKPSAKANVPPALPDAPEMAAKDPVVIDAAVEAAVEAPDAAQAAATPADAGAAPDRPAATDCVVELASTPPGAEVVHDKEVVGTTPAKLMLPCGVETKLVVRKAKFASSMRSVTPTAAGVKLRVPLVKAVLVVKVTSSPTGATITMNGKPIGVTPTAVKLPALETSTIVISKPGFGPETQKVTPKTNNQAVHTTLKKKGR